VLRIIDCIAHTESGPKGVLLERIKNQIEIVWPLEAMDYGTIRKRNMTTATTGQAPSAPTNLEEVFLSLAQRWKEERGPSSSTTELAMCPSYQRIIGLEPAVLPFLLR